MIVGIGCKVVAIHAHDGKNSATDTYLYQEAGERCRVMENSVVEVLV